MGESEGKTVGQWFGPNTIAQVLKWVGLPHYPFVCVLLCLLVLTYLCPSLPVMHRPSMTPRQCTLFWAALVIPVQLVPCCLSSASVFRLQLLRGRPLFLFPCGFQVRDWHVVLDTGFLRVCPIQPHFLCSICLTTGSCPARCLLVDWFNVRLWMESSLNTFRTTNKTFSFSAWHRQRPQTRNSRSRPVLSFLCSVCWSNCP